MCVARDCAVLMCDEIVTSFVMTHVPKIQGKHAFWHADSAFFSRLAGARKTGNTASVTSVTTPSAGKREIGLLPLAQGRRLGSKKRAIYGTPFAR